MSPSTQCLGSAVPLAMFRIYIYTEHLKCGLGCGRVWWICGRVGNAKARGKMREIGALCSSDSVQSVACDIWTHYATQNRCTVLLIFGVVCGLDWQCGWTQYTTWDQCTMPQLPCISCSLFCKVYWWCINHSDFVQPLVQTQIIQGKKKTLPRPGSKPSSSSMESNLICMISVAPEMWNLCSRGIEIAQKRSSVWCMMGSQKSGSGSPAICPSNHHTTTIPMQWYHI